MHNESTRGLLLKGALFRDGENIFVTRSSKAKNIEPDLISHVIFWYR